jgi:hypothetical protein
MKYICAQPENLYYRWQVDTMINSFLQNGVQESDIIILSNTESQEFNVLKEKYPSVNFHRYYSPVHSYQPAIKPYLMYLYFKDHQEDEQYFYCDCDVILTKPLPEFEQGVFMSDTVSYIGYEYIKSKGQDVVDIICETIGLPESILIENQSNSGGCQFVFNTMPADVWRQAFKYSYYLYTNLGEYNGQNGHLYENTYPIQVWTAEMWGTLYAMWYYGYYGTVDSRLDFAWSTDSSSRLNETSILHNAGVSDQPNLFKKSIYINELPPCDLIIDSTKCSNYYYIKVKEVICND